MVIGLAVILGIVGLQILDDSNGSGNATGTTTPGASTSGPTTTAITVRPNNEVRVKVYNASGVQGRAQTLTDTLRAKGYNMQTPATLGDQRQGNVVECTDAFKNEATPLALFGVGNATVQPFPSSPPDGASDADCLVIIGTA